MLKINRLKVLVILALPATALICFSQLHTCESPRKEEPAQTHILILSSWRSGSSFVGQIFSQHPDVFYLMEPAWHVWVTMHQSSAKALQMAVRDLVRSVFKCDMSVFDAYMSEQRNQRALFQWEASRALCSPPACHLFQRSDIISKQACKTLCGKYPFRKVAQACKTYSHVVLKEVRLFNLKALNSLFADPSLNLKIIHLVRDPRAVFRSREHTAGDLAQDSGIVVGHRSELRKTEPYAVMREICKSHLEMYTQGSCALPSHLQGRYLLVRYEDIVRDPLALVVQLYRFAGLHLIPRLQSWVHNITHGHGLGTEAFDVGSRDAVNVSQAWRKTLPYPKVAKLQEACEDAMGVLGYRLVRSEAEQTNMSLSLLHPQKSLAQPGKGSPPASGSWSFQKQDLPCQARTT
ncbi:PREDICTED: carbohydrate sulfotransferase 4-like [Gekko japonicus]|uniref:Carbohydrate sulfotransferase 4-like n=1 Tax=Gekko japonicus TaxID=146911 RepID=A0ABM1LCK4_GEKJA|nr:PREDICTED: carbohydrate sulfotransferase 4-like [Gekko japonicus]